MNGTPVYYSDIVTALWVRTGFNAGSNPGPAFYLNADLDPDSDQGAKPVRISPNTGPSQKSKFLHE